MQLTSEQKYAFEKITKGENLFITGPGGSGKSVFIKELVKYFKNKSKRTQVCALTGCAAILLECSAKTIHSWGGLGLARGNIESLARKISMNKHKRQNWKCIDVLIVDEVSMMSEKLFNLIDLIAKICRNSDQPFGGIQVVFCGDFYQLPPVGDENNQETYNFCFESSLFDITFPNKVQFTKIFRQKDPIYTKILNQIRIGRISRNTVEILKKYVNREIDLQSGFCPTILYPKKKQVDKVNKQSMENLETESRYFSLCKYIVPLEELSEIDRYKLNDLSEEQISYEHEYLINSINCDNNLELKIGAQVMCVINLDLDDNQNPICNGSQGIIKDFDFNGNPIVKFYNGRERTMSPHCWISENCSGIGVKQIPLILSWAITIHKSQGTSLELAQIDVGSDIFECGQTYVALSRLIRLDGLYLKSFNPCRIKINLKVVRFYSELE